MPGYIRFISCCTALFSLAVATAAGQSLVDYATFYRLLRITATEQLVFCHPTSTPDKDPLSYGVLLDSLQRPIQITRFMFGNPDSRGDWTTMRIRYTRYDTIRTEVQRRTFFNASGMPIILGEIAAEEVLHRIDGPILMRKLVDRSGKLVNGPGDVSRTMYRAQDADMLIQEWYYSNGKHHYGSGSDGPLRPFAPMPEQTYFRLMKIDANGNLLREEVWDFNKRPIPFPGGEKVRAYELNDCGQPIRVTFLTTHGQPMSDSDGVAYKTFAYDHAGRMIEWKAYGASGKPKGRHEDGVAAARYIVREFDGVFIREERFNEQGELMP